MTSDTHRIFIVEDEVVVAFEMTDMLEDLGFEVVGPSVHVEDAKRLADEAKIDAAFLDVNMGAGKTSKPVAEILRDRDIPFVFITAYSADQISFKTSDEKVLSKPVTSSQVLSTLRKVLPDLEE
ncbi:response regulator [Sphingomicrobium sediminis]|uniref:Response regulator n=1 Tax=Sphingomicrobium sediminis TaxID=2950949 RepID=A0A9X2EIT4_9SPHN|nr:response regulator [Sphingomicrobium sediminis]